MREMFRRKPDGPLSALGLSVVGATVVIDQASKWIAEVRLPLREMIDILPFLAFYRVNNVGIAFSMLSAAGGLPLIVMTLAISLIVLVFWWRAAEGGQVATVGFALIVGGAIGNLIDRLLSGHVIDFLLLHFGDWTLFVFNLADVALSLGPVMLLAVYLFPHRQEASR